MKTLLFTAGGRIARGPFWKGVFIILGIEIAAVVVNFVLAQIMGVNTPDGFSAQGLQAIPFIVLDVGVFVAIVWAGICLGIKRYHDRGKSGAWVLIQFVPIIGIFWYFIETGFLRGTVGANRYGADPLSVTNNLQPGFA